MIRTFKHKGLENFFKHGSKAGISPSNAARLKDRLVALNEATGPQLMNVPGWKFHALEGVLEGHWSIWVSGNWRMTFTFEGSDAIFVDYQDYH